MSEAQALAAALDAEHAAIYGYGVVGAKLDAATRPAAREAEAAHRNRRDALATTLVEANSTPPPAAPGYKIPFPVTDRASAVKLAITLEEGTARAWRAALAETTGDQRRTALEALTDCAVRATRWRVVAGSNPSIVPFPGVPA